MKAPQVISVIIALCTYQPVYLSTQIGLSANQAAARDLFEHKDLGTYEHSFKAIVDPSGVVMVKLTPRE